MYNNLTVLSILKLKAVVLNDNLEILNYSEVDFDRQLPEFRTQGGAIQSENGVVTSPVTLWIKAVDLLLDQMKLNGVDFSKVKALSGAAQQHGSIYWQKNAKKALNNLDSCHFLFQQLQSCFSIKQTPIWMDSSTSVYCKQLEDAVGGPEKMAEITGSRAYERFTGPQIAKIVDQRPGLYDITERISLISSFACSLFLGDYADVDYADASGMNLMDIKTKDWSDSCIKALKASNVMDKLGQPKPPLSKLGVISKYYVERFGFNSECQIIIFTGDNPATLAGMCLSENDLAVSLGTSDTIILPLKEPKSFLNGHLMCSPLKKDGYMGMLCFKNGSLTRERMRNLYADSSWEKFSKLLYSTPRGNFGNFGLYFDSPEILPFLKKGEYRWNSLGETVSKFGLPEIEIRALMEGQFVARKSYVEELGFTKNEKSRIIATGGGSQNEAILQVLSDVFNIPVYVQKFKNSAALGSAYIAKHALENESSFEDIIRCSSEVELVCTPSKDSTQVYSPMMLKYKSYVNNLIKTYAVGL